MQQKCQNQLAFCKVVHISYVVILLKNSQEAYTLRYRLIMITMPQKEKPEIQLYSYFPYIDSNFRPVFVDGTEV